MKSKTAKLTSIADDLRCRSRYSESLSVFRKALTLSKREGDIDGVLKATMGLADVCRVIGRFEAAIEYYDEAFDMCEALDMAVDAADTLVGKGVSLKALGRWKEGQKLIRTARSIYKKAKDTKGIAFSEWAEGCTLRVAGKITEAIRRFEDARRLFSSAKHNRGVAYALCGLGGTHRVAGNFRQSLKHYAMANDLTKALRDRFGTAYSHCGMGNAKRMLGDFAGAMRHFRVAERLYKSIGDKVSYSYTLWSMANVCKMRGSLQSAKQHIKAAEDNFRKTKDPRGLIYCNLTMGEIEFLEGRQRSAMKRFQRSLGQAQHHGFKLEACHAQMLIGVCSKKGLNEPRALSAKREAGCYRSLGVTISFGSIPANIP